MCDLFAIIKSIDGVVSDLDILLQEAEENSPIENLAANKVQRLFRGWKTRVRIYNMNLSALVIERLFRGHSSRLICRRMVQEKANGRKLLILQYFALQLQKSFRGYYSRKYRQDHSLRKQYLKNVELAGQRVRQSMNEYAKKLTQDEEDREISKREESFKTLSENLHHLVSTKQIRGVYNPHPNLIGVPTVNEVPVESYLRGAVKDLLKTKGLTKSGMVRDLNGTLKIPMKGVKNRLSLQASVPYDVLEKERLREKVRHKIAMQNKDAEFHSGHKTDIINTKTTPLCVNDAFMDQWANPLMQRGVPKSQKDMLATAHSRTTASTYHPMPQKPFYLTTAGNKNVVLPNDMFDTIADAEENGGVTRRHLGKNSRFGLSQNCDNRVPSGTLPVPPIKSAILVPTKR